MSFWIKSEGLGGLPIWQGEESIFSAARTDEAHIQSQAAAGGVLAWVGCWTIIVIGLALLIPSKYLFNKGGLFLFLLLGGSAAAGVWAMQRHKALEKWLGKPWTLTATPSAFRYEKESGSWNVSYDEIARVESGRTVDWQRVREYPILVGTRQLLIPDVEMQVFIFCNDGRRLVIQTANAAREDCGRLAHSIREYVETVRSAAPVAAPSSAAPPAGFDL